jgi:Zn-dependent protease
LNADTLHQILLVAPIFIFSIVAHEVAHGYAALRQGDPTAYQLGRLTFNPLKHIDPFLSIVMPAFLYWATNGAFVLGGAKPVPVNPRNYRSFRRGDIVVALAGVVTNFVLAGLCAAIIPVLGLLGRGVAALEPTCGLLQAMMGYGIFINALLGVFNLLPIPPLDGSHVIKHLLPRAWALRYQEFGRFGLLVLVLLVGIGRPVLNDWVFAPVTHVSQSVIAALGGYLLPSALPWL